MRTQADLRFENLNFKTHIVHVDKIDVPAFIVSTIECRPEAFT